MITIDGLVSGIDTESIVEGLLEIQQLQVDRIELKRADVLARQATFSGLEASLVSLRADVSQLARVQNSPLTGNSISVSDETSLTASSSSSAVPGVYRLTVDTVARAHQVASQGFADSDSAINTGTLEIRVGSGELTTITVDASNNTLEGLTESINASGSGLNASIIQDASGGASPYRLLLTSSETGTDNQISITNNLTSGGATQPAFDLGNPVQAAEDAQVTIGSGPGAISVESSTNRFGSLIAGVSVDLLNASDGNEVTITVAHDTESAVEAVDSFVNSFNAVLGYIDERSQFNAETEDAGILLGNRSAINIQQQLQQAIISVVPGVSTDLNRLSAIGITVTDKGALQLNRSKLENVLNGNVEGHGPQDVKRLFALGAESTTAGINFVLGSGRTLPSGDTPYQVDITQAAARAALSGTTDLAASTVIDSSNRTIDLTLDGAATTITLDEGTYTRQELADHVESLVNGSSELAGRAISATLDGDQLNITSDSYGNSSSLLLSGGTALTALGFTAGAAEVGRDVAGTFIVDGEVESAVGRGQLLSGNAENANTADLQLRITLQESQVTTGIEGEVTVTQGLGGTLDKVLDGILDPIDGRLQTIDDSFNEELESLQTSLDRQQAVFDRQQEVLIREFTALETALSQLQSTSQFVSSQLANLSSAR
jgi:flagellar hook-associated protein 2